MDDFQRKLNMKLLDRFAEMLVEVELRPTEKALAEFWKIWNAVNGAARRLGLPCDEAPAVRPSPVAIDEFLTRVAAEGSERGGELTLQ